MSLLISDFPALAALGATQKDLDHWASELESGKFPVRFTVEVGTHPTVEELVAAVEASGNRFSDWTRGLLPEVTISDRKVLKIVTPTVRELGFTAEWTPLRDVHVRGIGLGYELVPSDLPLSLRLQYRDQPMNEAIFMAMKALKHPDGSLDLFYVKCGSDGRFVLGGYGNPEYQCLLGRRFAFVDPQA